MADLIYIIPRDNPEYFYKKVLEDINYNFSGISTGLIVLSGLNSTSIFSNSITATTFYSGSTNLGDLITGGTISTGNFLSLTGGTVSGDTNFTQSLSSNVFSAQTIYSGSTDLSSLINTSLQNAYNNSSDPEIQTNSILGAVTFKDGIGLNSNVIEIQDNSGNTNSIITANGVVYGRTLSGNTSIYVNEFFHLKNATNNYQTYIPGAFGGYINWVANSGGNFLTIPLDTATIQSRATQTSTTPIFRLNRTENQNNILYLQRLQVDLNTANNTRANLGGRVDYWMRPEGAASSVNSHNFDFLWENDVTTSSERNSYFRFQTLSANTMADRFYINSAGVKVLGKISLSGSTPTNLQDGDIWCDAIDLKLQTSGITTTVVSYSGSATNGQTVVYSNGTWVPGAIASGTPPAVNLFNYYNFI